MIETHFVVRAENNDAELVAQSLVGNRDAFGAIVSRYQSLLCSIAYSATGSLSRSEDLAQETFLTAWKQLGNLREPARLRAWLCGIARNLTYNAIRRDRREPASVGEPMEMIENAPVLEPLPIEQIISREEEALLWRSLERIPESYREPLVLFYRQQQSIERVASELDLSEDAVKQRLSRGRKLLQEQVLAFVEGTLERSSPGKAFTIAVLAALPAYTLSVSAATVSAGTAKGGLTAKSAGWLAAINLFLVGIASFLGSYFGMRASLNTTRTRREREYVLSAYKEICVGVGLYLAALIAFVSRGSFWIQHPLALAMVGITLALCYCTWLSRLIWRCLRKASQVRAEEQQLFPEIFEQEKSRGQPGEYRSSTRFLGAPLVHIRCGPSPEGAKPVFGWIAMGDRAVGILFAMGGLACGTISVGGLSAGIISMGALSLGLFSTGSAAIGLLAMGSMALGIITVGPVSVAWHFAMGPLAIARNMGLGGNVLAAHANDALAQSFFAGHHGMAAINLALGAIAFFTAVPMAWLAWRTRRRNEELESTGTKPSANLP